MACDHYEINEYAIQAYGSELAGGILNCSHCGEPLLQHFAKKVVDSQRKWDLRWLVMSGFIAGFSKDPSTRTGAVIIRPDKSLVSTGFNGFPACMEDKPEWYANREEKYSRVVHCEVNSQLFARESLQGYTLYTWPFASCDRCVVQMLQAGIKRYVFPTPTTDALSRWGAAFDRTKGYIESSGAVYTEIPRTDILASVKENFDLVMAELAKV